MSFANLKWKHVPRYTKNHTTNLVVFFRWCGIRDMLKTTFFFKEERSVQLRENKSYCGVVHHVLYKYVEPCVNKYPF
jgi:hypothetical protein